MWTTEAENSLANRVGRWRGESVRRVGSVSMYTKIQVTFDAADPEKLAEFWGLALDE